jgi:glutamyl-tRNA synthetase
VIQRADGSCLYHLASVVDDHDLEITHVIRAEEHLSNTPRQAFIALSLGYHLPAYAHLPLVAEPGSRTKLSKRKLAQYLKNPDFKQVAEHGTRIAERIGLTADADTFNPVIVDFYREVGYLPWAIDNYLALLGWSFDDKTEFFSRDELIAHFTLERINSSPASFDPKKLWAVQDHYMHGLTVDEKLAFMLPFLIKAKLVADPVPPAAAAAGRQARRPQQRPRLPRGPATWAGRRWGLGHRSGRPQAGRGPRAGDPLQALPGPAAA